MTNLPPELKKKLEQPFLERIVYIGEEVPETLTKDDRPKFVLLGTPAELLDQLETLFTEYSRQERVDEVETVVENLNDFSYYNKPIDISQLKDFYSDRLKDLKALTTKDSGGEDE